MEKKYILLLQNWYEWEQDGFLGNWSLTLTMAVSQALARYGRLLFFWSSADGMCGVVHLPASVLEKYPVIWKISWWFWFEFGPNIKGLHVDGIPGVLAHGIVLVLVIIWGVVALLRVMSSIVHIWASGLHVWRRGHSCWNSHFIDWCRYLVLKSIEDGRATIEEDFFVWRGKKPSI